jgi:hypothetical protein
MNSPSPSVIDANIILRSVLSKRHLRSNLVCLFLDENVHCNIIPCTSHSAQLNNAHGKNRRDNSFLPFQKIFSLCVSVKCVSNKLISVMSLHA